MYCQSNSEHHASERGTVRISKSVAKEIRSLILLAVVTGIICLQASPTGRFWNVVIFIAICTITIGTSLLRDSKQ